MVAWGAFSKAFSNSASPLYAYLSDHIAEAPAVADVILQVPAHQPVPNLVLSAVHERLLAGVVHPLREWYPTLGGTRSMDAALIPAFNEFVALERDSLIALVRSRTVQTNEVRRCALWLPALVWLGRQVGPFEIFEMGASAGLNLLWQHYGYRYGDRRAGAANATLQLECELRGKWPELDPLPEITAASGGDLFPVPLDDAQAVRWLKALVWPDQVDRLQRLEQALEIARLHPPQVTAMSGVRGIQRLSQGPLCILNSFVLNQFSETQRADWEQDLRRLSEKTPVWNLGIEWIGTPTAELTASRYERGKQISTHLLARVDHHGRWLEWVG